MPFAIAIFMKIITLGTAFDYQLNSSTMTVEDTCLDAGIVDSTIIWSRRLLEGFARGVSIKKYFSYKKAARWAAFFCAVLQRAARCAAHMIPTLFQESLHDLNDQADDVDKQAVNRGNAAYF